MAYSKFYNDKWTEVYDLDDCIRAIQCRNEDNEERIKFLEETNQMLRDAHYKDAELQQMKQKLERMQKDYWRGFPISEEEMESIKAWKKQHDEEVHGWTTDEKRMKAEGCCGGRYSFHFIPTSIVTLGYVKCSCGAEFQFQEV